MRNRRAATIAGLLLCGLLSASIHASAANAAATCKGTAPSDFNGDGISDVAIGEPGNGTGDVHVIYGTRSGLNANATATTPNDQVFTPGFPDAVEYGLTLTTLDFNGDGCTDLAIGDPMQDTLVATAPQSLSRFWSTRSGRPTAHVRPDAQPAPPGGWVEILLGSPEGLTTSTIIRIDSDDAGHTSQAGGELGFALAAGDFNGDGKDDLAIGAPGEDSSSGAVYLIPGSTNATVTAYRFAQGDNELPPGDGHPDLFGTSLAAGDFNDDGKDDLAIGVPGLNSFAGAVDVTNGSATAPYLPGSGVTQWSQNSDGVAGTSEPSDLFGLTLATGDFRGDNRTDLAIGVPGEAIGTLTSAGMVNVLYSAGSDGLSSAGNQGWWQDSPGISGTSEANDFFGGSLATGDFKGNGRDDLAVGVPGEGIGSASSAGMVNLIMGSAGGLSASGQQAWSQSSTGIAGTPETNDEFGTWLAAGRIRSASRDDLVIGVSGEGLGSVANAGEIQVIPGASGGLTATHSQDFSANSSGVQGTAVKNGFFGDSVT